jgi:antitoxin YefM
VSYRRRIDASDGSLRSISRRPTAQLPIILYMMTTIPLAALRSDLSAHIASVEATHDRVAITRNGRVVAVLIAPDDLESLEETIGWLDEEPYASAIRRLIDEEAGGTAVPLETALAEAKPAKSA